VVCEKGVLVIETKNCAGTLYGDDEQREWTQVLAGGRVKNALYNPVKQNATHCYHIRRIVGRDVPVKSIVVLIRDNADKLSCSGNVIGLSGLQRYLSSLPSVMDDDEIADAYQKLSAENVSRSVSSRRHNRNVKRRARDVARGICPRCGGVLLPRCGEDNVPFRGCKNYPKCRFTTKRGL
ncbi:MAG: NERD domain-containing protein, partial [Clostridia bacterium]|nr:NERD domain-containing protein [Clostridia bacterium]